MIGSEIIMDNKPLSIILMAFITIIVSVILISSLGEQNQRIQTLDTVTDDTFTASTTCTRVATGCIDSITNVKNLSVTAAVGNYTLCTSSTGNIDGIQLATTLYTGTMNATYTHSPSCGYVKDGTSRTLSNLIPLFFAIAILLAVIFYIKRSEIFDMF